MIPRAGPGTRPSRPRRRRDTVRTIPLQVLFILHETRLAADEAAAITLDLAAVVYMRATVIAMTRLVVVHHTAAAGAIADLIGFGRCDSVKHCFLPIDTVMVRRE